MQNFFFSFFRLSQIFFVEKVKKEQKMSLEIVENNFIKEHLCQRDSIW